MSEKKQMIEDLTEIFDEEYEKRRLITPQNTAEKLTAKGYHKQSEVAREIFEELRRYIINHCYLADDDVDAIWKHISKLEKRYTEDNNE